MANVSALKEVYKALGGSLTDTYSTIAGGAAVSNYTLSSDVILAIAEKAGTKELPKVTASDNGKVLKVVNGAWAAGTDET